MERRILYTREELERTLMKGLTGKVVSFPDIRDTIITGVISRIAVNVASNNELLVSFQIVHVKYEFDLQYFIENLTVIYGDPSTRDDQYVRRLLKKN